MSYKNILTLGTGTIILLLIGLFNGYPLFYSDSGTYIYSGFNMFIPFDRPVTYGLFIKFFSLKYSTWFVTLIQNFITAFVLFQFLKVIFDERKYFQTIYISIIFFLTMVTGIGWYSNQIMPDFFTPLMILCIYILLFKKETGTYITAILSLILVYSLITHFTHLLIGSVLIAFITLTRFVWNRSQEFFSSKKLIYVSVIVSSSWLLLPSINFLIEKQFVLSKGSHVFLMGHLNDTGILKKILNENCENEEFKNCRLCGYKDALPSDLSSFIWSGEILKNTGDWAGSEEEYNLIILESLKNPKYLFLNMYKSVTYGLIQLTRNDIGQGLTAYNEGSAPYSQVSWRFNDELNNYVNSKQNKWNGVGLNFDLLNSVHLIVIVISILFLITLFSTSFYLKIDGTSLFLILFILLALVINAFVTAGLNSPCDRFQARIVWILPLTIIAVITNNFRLIRDNLKKLKTQSPPQ